MASKSKKGLGRGLGALFDDSKSEKSSEGFDFLSDLSDTEIADSDSCLLYTSPSPRDTR